MAQYEHAFSLANMPRFVFQVFLFQHAFANPKAVRTGVAMSGTGLRTKETAAVVGAWMWNVRSPVEGMRKLQLMSEE